MSADKLASLLPGPSARVPLRTIAGVGLPGFRSRYGAVPIADVLLAVNAESNRRTITRLQVEGRCHRPGVAPPKVDINYGGKLFDITRTRVEADDRSLHDHATGRPTCWPPEGKSIEVVSISFGGKPIEFTPLGEPLKVNFKYDYEVEGVTEAAAPIEPDNSPQTFKGYNLSPADVNMVITGPGGAGGRSDVSAVVNIKTFVDAKNKPSPFKEGTRVRLKASVKRLCGTYPVGSYFTIQKKLGSYADIVEGSVFLDGVPLSKLEVA